MKEQAKTGISRRSFLTGAAATGALAAAAGLMGCAPQQAADGKTEAGNAGAAGAGEGGASSAAAGHTWDVKPDPIPESDIAGTTDVDVVVIGAGNAGVAAACSAVEEGLKVTVIEKTETVNGRGGGVGACNSRLNKELGFEIEPIAAQYRWNRTCGNRNSEALVTKWFKNSGPAMDWLLDKADQYGATYTLYAGYSRSAILPEEPDFHTFQAGSFAIPQEAGYFVPTALLYQSCLDQGVEFLFGHTAEQLVQDESGKVTGVMVKAADGTYQQFNASKGVVLATGDIAGDQEMREAYLEPLFVDMRSDYMPQGANTGDGHKMGMWAGGVMQDGPLPNALHPQGGSTFHGPFMFVNKEGKRYFNEANWVQAKSIQTMKQTDHVGFSIFDKNFPTDNKDSLNHGGGMFWDTMSRSVTQEFDPAEILATVEGEVEQGNTAWKADTLEELADLIGVDKENFLAEVENYNKMCEAGEDTQFEKEPVFLYPIKEPPFYATKVEAVILVCVGGLKVNTDLAVVKEDGTPIDGLFATGNTSGDLYAVDYPINMPGNSNGRCLTWGYLLGKTLAAR